MALDRQSIEKKDFPIARRGYDPAAVDEHLRALADEMDTLRRQAEGRPAAAGGASLASTASDQIRLIVEAAETTAAGIQQDAEREARELRDRAEQDAADTRSQAGQQAREHVSRVSEATHQMLQRLDAMEGELGSLVDSLKTGSNRLTADLSLLEGNVSELRGTAAPAPAPTPPPPPRASEPVAAEPTQPVAVPAPTPPPAEPDIPAAAPSGADDTEGARLIALNMALNGSPREETDRYLAENFQLSDRAALLDEVYASIGQ